MSVSGTESLICNFSEQGCKCGEPAISAVFVEILNECKYLCKKHVYHTLVSSAIERGSAKRMSLEEAVTFEIITS
jgi:hypothetical protein